VLGAQTYFAEEDYVDLWIICALLIQHLMLGEVQNLASSQDLLQRDNCKFRKDWVLCVDHSVADIDAAWADVLKLVLKFVETILDLLLYGSWQFAILANKFWVVWMLVVGIH